MDDLDFQRKQRKLDFLKRKEERQQQLLDEARQSKWKTSTYPTTTSQDGKGISSASSSSVNRYTSNGQDGIVSTHQAYSTNWLTQSDALINKMTKPPQPFREHSVEEESMAGPPGVGVPSSDGVISMPRFGRTASGVTGTFIGYPHTKGSPESSVSLSQPTPDSPCKRQPFRFAPAVLHRTNGPLELDTKNGEDKEDHNDTNSTSSSEGEDLMSMFQKMQQNKRKKSSLRLSVGGAYVQSMEVDGSSPSTSRTCPSHQQQPSAQSTSEQAHMDDYASATKTITTSKSNIINSGNTMERKRFLIEQENHYDEVDLDSNIPPSKSNNKDSLQQKNPLRSHLLECHIQTPQKAASSFAVLDDMLWSDSDGEKKDDNKGKGRRKATSNISKPVNTKSESEQQLATTTKSGSMIDAVNHDGDTIVDELALKPEFVRPKFGPFETVPLNLGPCDAPCEHRVPASINRYLPNYQQVGIDFMYNQVVVRKQGAILGDDMGLGKTVQVIALAAALLEKTGTGQDMIELTRRKRMASEHAAHANRAQQEAFAQGHVSVNRSSRYIAEGLPQWAPILICCPPSILQNWIGDFDMWGYFGVSVYQGDNRHQSLEKIRYGEAEILLSSKSLFVQESDFSALLEIPWKIAIFDEFHSFKNDKGKLAKNLRQLRDVQNCKVIGLTGTPMQNHHKELWNLIDLAEKDFFGPWEKFEHEFSKPIKLARTKDANPDAVKLGEKKSRDLSQKLNTLFLQRTKADVLKNDLPVKNERVVFCEASILQRRIYEHILKQPDFTLLSQAIGPCDCGVNQVFFANYDKLKTKAERIDYQRRHKQDVVSRADCCYKVPKSHDSHDGIDPDAVLWREQHPSGDQCANCPYCILLPGTSLLDKLSSHVALIQPHAPPEHFLEGTEGHKKALKMLERAKVFFPDDIVAELPGKNYYRDAGIMSNHFVLSGKMAVLERLLRAIDRQQGRVLLFSYSTQMLDLIQSYVQSAGYSHLRMDGSTATKRRNELVDEFKNSNCFLFLLSTKAMGLGLNLTEANFVIIFDVDWNPSWDLQAQDRAYRIGQEKDVTVFRLVARGTIEELRYLRQVYKTHLKRETIVDWSAEGREASARLFRGVAGDKQRKGELFGAANLLKFRDGTFMDYGSNATVTDKRKYGDLGISSTMDVIDSVKEMSKDELYEIGNEGNMYMDISTNIIQGSCDVNDELALGGESQVIINICDQAEVPTDADGDEAPERDAANADLELRPEPSNRKASRSSTASGEDSSQHGRRHLDDRKTGYNFTLVGKSYKDLRNRKNGGTTFSVHHLALPSDFKVKKKRKAGSNS